MIAATPKNALDKVKVHIQENKKVYIVGGVCLVVGLAGGTFLVKNKDVINVSVEGIGNNVVGKAKTVNQVTIELVERSTPSKPVHLVGTNLYFNSLSEAARETGHHLSQISKHVNGHIPDLNGDVFEVLELA
ncbi:membrane protein [Gordonia phage Avazak]|uniref:Membrane protein n=1 Tax=Gordonia phage Avazak TaxID=2656529 RepID=A0A649V7Q9_9CAUD|nr:membrane protein [Gordonia phage Avazak]QGJ88035.1 membrane protein [Gordonia phage Avazak]